MDDKERQELYEKLVQGAYNKGKAINAASALEFDEVIDPKDTRKWIGVALNAFQNKNNYSKNKFIDSW